jgi:hypothetical protein
MKTRLSIIACFAVLSVALPLATNSLAQDYVANVFTFGHSGQFK